MTLTAHMTPTPRGLEAALDINRKALMAGGVRTGPLTTTWDLSASGKLPCTDPQKTTNVYHQPLDDWIVDFPPNRPRQYLDLTTRCRRCPNCLKLRAWIWTLRMRVEMQHAERTWFGTLTLAPLMHERARLHASLAAGKSGRGDFRGMSADNQFDERVRVINGWITDYVKRVRKSATGPVRLAMVVERHKSGLPHMHCLFHEVQLGCLSERLLGSRWPYGHSQFRLVHDAERASRYVAKYLTKSLLARIRASKGYGSLERAAMHRPIGLASDPDALEHSSPQGSVPPTKRGDINHGQEFAR